MLKSVSDLGVDIMITETGAPDKGDSVRAMWIKRYLYAFKKWLHEENDKDKPVKALGFVYWSLMDNFEWNLG